MDELEIFTHAFQHSDRAERARYLDQACGADTVLRARLDRLLARHDNSHSLLDRPAAENLDLQTNPITGDERGKSTPAFSINQLLAFLKPAKRPGSLGRLGHYELLEVLGQGGFGIVIKAFDDSLHRVVAIKILAPHLAVTSPPRKRFLREARAAAQVKHEHVVQIHAVAEEPLPYLVMEFIDGQTLQEKLDTTGPLDAADVVRLGRQIALGLAAAHEKGLIHRDVKPANILLESGLEQRVKLTDFGLARAADDASISASGVVAGTPLYMAPEQARGEQLDHRADLFSLGSVLYAACTGRPPFRAAGTLAILKRVSEDEPRPIREVIPEVPEGLCAVIARLHRKDPAERFASAEEVAEALSRCLSEPVTLARPRGHRSRWAVVAALMLFAGAVWGVFHFAWPALGGRQPSNAAAPDVSTKRPLPEEVVPANAIVVTSTLDDGSEGTLRWAVEQAARPGPDTIVFDPAVFVAPQTITMTLGSLRLTDPAQTTILGPPAGLTLSGKENSNQQALWIHNTSGGTAVVTIRGLTLSGFILGTGNGSRGAALFVGNGDVVLDQVTVADCFCNFGGGVFNIGMLRVIDSTFTANASTGGGAILNFGMLTIVNSTFSGNRSDGSGGAIQNSGGSTKILCSTLTANTAGRAGGAVYNEHDNTTVTLVNTIAAGNKGRQGPDLVGAVTATNCLIGSTAGATLLTGSGQNVTGESARLGPLSPNGGPTQTHALLPDSPAIDAGNNDLVPRSVRTDQRGSPRRVGGAVDIGAYEAQ